MAVDLDGMDGCFGTIDADMAHQSPFMDFQVQHAVSDVCD